MPTASKKLDENLKFLENLLLKSPENNEKLFIENVTAKKNSIIIDVGNGKSKWRHKIQTEEV